MNIKYTYKGLLNGVYGIFCGFKPEGLDVQETIPVYYPDEGKVFTKNNENFDCVVLQEGESIDDYREVDKLEEANNDNI